MKSLDSVKPLDTAELIQSNYSNLTDPLRNKVARPPNLNRPQKVRHKTIWYRFYYEVQ